MFHTLIQPLFILVLFVLVRATDLAIGYMVARDALRAAFYWLVAVLALIFIVLTLFGL
jgi:hypothetical protein